MQLGLPSSHQQMEVNWWGGFPSNLGGLQLVKQYMAEEIGVDDGEIVAVSKGLHLYDYSWDLAKLRTNKNNLVLK